MLFICINVGHPLLQCQGTHFLGAQVAYFSCRVPEESARKCEVCDESALPVFESEKKYIFKLPLFLVYRLHLLFAYRLCTGCIYRLGIQAMHTGTNVMKIL